MIPIRASEIVDLDLGELSLAGDVITGVLADSRVVGPGDLFVALNSGVRYVGEAQARGAATLVPHEQLAALAALARLVRDRSSARVVAVVGSTGKTTTKDILNALCSVPVPTVATAESQNNEIGLPLTVCRLEPATQVLVAEMGMRGLGQIADLCEVARPELAVVTSIGPEHLELLGSVEAVARANAEAIGALPEGGIAVVPAGCHELEPYLRADVDVRTFDPNTVARAGSRWRFPLRDAVIELELPFTQRHLAENVLAALVAYDALGLPLDRLEEGASKIRLSQWRGEVLELAGGGFVVNDAYNANPTSMRAALLDLAERGEGRRRVAILGEMAELGVESDRYHAEVAELVATHVDLLITVGARARAYAVAGGAVAYEAATVADVPDVVEPGDAVLVKASRSVGLEGLAPLLAKNVARRWEATT